MVNKTKILKKTYSVSVKLTRDYQSIQLTEGFEVEIDDQFNPFEFESLKQQLKDKLNEEGKAYLNDVVSQQKIKIDLD